MTAYALCNRQTLTAKHHILVSPGIILVVVQISHSKDIPKSPFPPLILFRDGVEIWCLRIPESDMISTFRHPVRRVIVLNRGAVIFLQSSPSVVLDLETGGLGFLDRCGSRAKSSGTCQIFRKLSIATISVRR